MIFMHIETPFIHHETLYRLFLFLLPHHQLPLLPLVTRYGPFLTTFLIHHQSMFFFFFLHEHASTNSKLYISTWQTKYMSWSAISTLILHRANSFLGIDAHVYEETLRTEGGYNGTQPYVYCRHQ